MPDNFSRSSSGSFEGNLAKEFYSRRQNSLILQVFELWKRTCKMCKLSLAFLLFYAAITSAKSVDPVPPYEEAFQAREEYSLPKLPYNYSDLEPYIDEETMRVHHLGHHAAYTAQLNHVLEVWRNSSEEGKELASKSLVEILTKINEVPEKYQHHLKNVGGGYFNHALYWATLAPNPTGEDRETGPLTDHLIYNTFENKERLRKWIVHEALDIFGSGNLWLCVDPKLPKHITIYSLGNQDTPFSHGLFPILLLDVWEHAYYLKHHNKRIDYINAWWNLVNWKTVEDLIKRYGVNQFHDEL